MIIMTMSCFQIFYADPIPGSVVGDRVEANDIVHYRLPFVQDQANYTSGGLTFIYPFAFSFLPRIFVSLRLLVSFNPAITYVATIENSSAANATIRVNKITYNGVNTIVAEAPTNEVEVNLFASGL